MDLKNKKVIFGGGKKVMMSYRVAKSLLNNAGLSDSEYTTKFSRNPPNALLAVLLRQADACWILKLKRIHNKSDFDKVKVIAESKNFPHLAWTLKYDLTDTIRNEIINLFMGLNNTEEGLSLLKKAKLTGLQKATHSENKIMLKYVDNIDNE